MLTTKQAAVRLKVTPRRVVALITAGRLPAVKLGRDWLVAEESLKLVKHRKTGRPRGRADARPRSRRKMG